MSACSHGYYADLRARRPGLPIYPVGATVVSGPGGLDGQYLDQAAPLPASGMRGRAAQPGAAAVAGARLWHIAGCHYCDVYRLAQALAAELRPRVTFAEGVAVTGLEPVGGGVTVHTSSGDRVAAGAVVLAPGPWLSAPGWRHLVAPLGLRVKKIVALHIERRPGPADEVVVFDSDDAFLLPARHRGHWLFSYCCREWDVDPDRAPAGLSARDVRAARECLLRWSPALAGACAGGRVFCDAYSPDGEPVVCALEDTGRIVFAGAASGSGYRLAPAIASQAVDLLLGEPSTMGARTTEGVTGDHQYV
jgi:glycine/D-amino acid oxidase-like deaminating enzyme